MLVAFSSLAFFPDGGEKIFVRAIYLSTQRSSPPRNQIAKNKVARFHA